MGTGALDRLVRGLATMLNFCAAPQLLAEEHAVGSGLVQVPEGPDQMPEVGGKS